MTACRSVLAEAIFASLLARSEEQLHVEVESASVGPAYEGGHDPRILQVPPATPSSGVPIQPHKTAPLAASVQRSFGLGGACQTQCAQPIVQILHVTWSFALC